MPAEALLRALRQVWLALKPLDVSMAVAGGLALASWKHVRATQDVDLLVQARQDDPAHLVERLRAAGLRPKRSPPTIRLGQLELIQFLYEPPETFLDVQIDVLLARSDYHRKALERRVPIRLLGLDIEIAVLACEDLILHKLLAGRIIDLADTAALFRSNRESLDFAYLSSWGRQLDLLPALERTWEEAWPGEPLPT